MTFQENEYVYYIGKSTIWATGYAAGSVMAILGPAKFQVRYNFLGNPEFYLGDAVVANSFLNRADIVKEKDLTRLERAVYGL